MELIQKASWALNLYWTEQAPRRARADQDTDLCDYPEYLQACKEATRIASHQTGTEIWWRDDPNGDKYELLQGAAEEAAAREVW